MPSASRLARWSLGSFGGLACLGGSFGGVCASVPLGPFLCRGAVPPFSCLSSGFAPAALGAVCFCDRVRVSGALRPASAVVPGCLCSCRWLALGLRPRCPWCGLFLWSGSGFRGSATRSCGRARFPLCWRLFLWRCAPFLPSGCLALRVLPHEFDFFSLLGGGLCKGAYITFNVSQALFAFRLWVCCAV